MSDDIVITLRQDYNDDWIETEPYTVIYKYKNERHEAAAEIERLRARVEVLEAALRDMLSGWRYIRETHGDLYGVGWDRAEEKARAALESTP